MNCAAIQLDLVAYHFGEVSEDARAKLETHLLACRSCLQDYLELKRRIETASDEEMPSTASRIALRRAAGQALDVPGKGRWIWWERPTALLVASAALIAALAVVHDIASAPGRRPRSLEAVASHIP